MRNSVKSTPSFSRIANEKERVDSMCKYALRQRNVEPAICLQLGKEAKELADKCGYLEGKGLALGIMAYQHWHLAQIELAERELKEGEDLLNEAKSYRHLGELRMVKSMITWGKGNYDKAFALVYDALKKMDEHGYKATEGVGWLYWTLGVFNYDLKDYKKSLGCYEKGLAAFRAIKPFEPNTISYSLIGIGCCNKYEGRTKEALQNFEEALGISKECNQWMQEARCYYEIGLIEFEEGNISDARAAQQKSYQMRKEHDTTPGMVSSLIALADLEAASNNIPLSMKYLEEALTHSKETNSKPKMYQCHEKLAALYKKTGNFEKALEHNQLFYKIRSEVVGEQASNRLKELETSYATERSEKEAEIQRLKNVELKKAHDLIAEKNKEILDSIHYAKRIQNAILPSVKQVEKHLKDCFVLYKPKDIIAGDFYWMEVENDTIFFSVADCTGHGVPGAMVSVMCSNALSKAVKELNIYEPAKILDKTVELLEERFEKSEEEVHDGMDLALCSIELNNRKLSYSGANNSLYQISSGELKEIKPDKQPVGKFSHRKPFTNHSIDLTPGDCFYIFTDGFADQFGGPKGKKFKYKQFKELLVHICNKPMEEQRELLWNAMKDWKGDTEQIDDICVLGFRVN